MSDFRLGGLASGLDTKALIDQLMQIERQPITRLQQKKATFQTERIIRRDINSQLSTLKSKLSDLKLSATFAAKTYTSTDSDVITATVDTTADKGTYEINIRELARAHSVASDRSADPTASIGLTGDFTINGKTVVIDNTNNSLAGIRDAINGTADIGVTASIIDNTLVIKAKETGIANTISFADGTNNLLQTLGVLDGVGAVKNELTSALDADLSINGLDITSSSNTLTNVISGVTLNLKQKGTTETVEVVDDTQSVIKKVKDFVDQYNKAYSTIANSMKKNETTGTWGVLSGDSTAMRVQNYLRSHVTGSISTGNDTDHLAVIGVEVDRYGVLSVDTDALEKALTEKPDEVMKLFTATTANDGYDGVVARLDSFLDNMLKTDGTIPNRVASYDDMVRDIDNRIFNLESQMDAKEAALYRQFTEMEKALSQMQQQSSWLMQQTSNMFASK